MASWGSPLRSREGEARDPRAGRDSPASLPTSASPSVHSEGTAWLGIIRPGDLNSGGSIGLLVWVRSREREGPATLNGAVPPPRESWESEAAHARRQRGYFGEGKGRDKPQGDTRFFFSPPAR